jgi:hypothetical protein
VDDCLRDAVARGAVLFDAGAFFRAHEVWEEHWRVETDETRRRFLQGLIQIAAAFHKLFVTGSADSALRLLTKGLAKLDRCPTLASDASITPFIEDVRRYATDVAAGRFDRAMVPSLGARTR